MTAIDRACGFPLYCRGLRGGECGGQPGVPGSLCALLRLIINPTNLSTIIQNILFTVGGVHLCQWWSFSKIVQEVILDFLRFSIIRKSGSFIKSTDKALVWEWCNREATKKHLYLGQSPKLVDQPTYPTVVYKFHQKFRTTHIWDFSQIKSFCGIFTIPPYPISRAGGCAKCKGKYSIKRN